MGSKSRIQKHDEQIIALFKKGFSSKEIAEKIGFCQGTVISHLKKLGLKEEKIKISDKKLTKLFQSGLSVLEISKKFNCRRPRILRRLQKLGLVLKKDRTITLNEEEIKQLKRISINGRQKSNKAKIILLANDGYKTGEISEKLGLQCHYISAVKACFLKKRMNIFDDPIGSGRSRKHKNKGEL